MNRMTKKGQFYFLFSLIAFFLSFLKIGKAMEEDPKSQDLVFYQQQEGHFLHPEGMELPLSIPASKEGSTTSSSNRDFGATISSSQEALFHFQQREFLELDQDDPLKEKIADTPEKKEEKRLRRHTRQKERFYETIEKNESQLRILIAEDQDYINKINMILGQFKELRNYVLTKDKTLIKSENLFKQVREANKKLQTSFFLLKERKEILKRIKEIETKKRELLLKKKRKEYFPIEKLRKIKERKEEKLRKIKEGEKNKEEEKFSIEEIKNIIRTYKKNLNETENLLKSKSYCCLYNNILALRNEFLLIVVDINYELTKLGINISLDVNIFDVFSQEKDFDQTRKRSLLPSPYDSLLSIGKSALDKDKKLSYFDKREILDTMESLKIPYDDKREEKLRRKKEKINDLLEEIEELVREDKKLVGKQNGLSEEIKRLSNSLKNMKRSGRIAEQAAIKIWFQFVERIKEIEYILGERKGLLKTIQEKEEKIKKISSRGKEKIINYMKEIDYIKKENKTQKFRNNTCVNKENINKIKEIMAREKENLEFMDKISEIKISDLRNNKISTIENVIVFVSLNTVALLGLKGNQKQKTCTPSEISSNPSFSEGCEKEPTPSSEGGDSIQEEVILVDPKEKEELVITPLQKSHDQKNSRALVPYDTTLALDLTDLILSPGTLQEKHRNEFSNFFSRESKDPFSLLKTAVHLSSGILPCLYWFLGERLSNYRDQPSYYKIIENICVTLFYSYMLYYSSQSEEAPAKEPSLPDLPKEVALMRSSSYSHPLLTRSHRGNLDEAIDRVLFENLSQEEYKEEISEEDKENEYSIHKDSEISYTYKSSTLEEGKMNPQAERMRPQAEPSIPVILQAGVFWSYASQNVEEVAKDVLTTGANSLSEWGQEIKEKIKEGLDEGAEILSETMNPSFLKDFLAAIGVPGDDPRQLGVGKNNDEKENSSPGDDQEQRQEQLEEADNEREIFSPKNQKREIPISEQRRNPYFESRDFLNNSGRMRAILNPGRGSFSRRQEDN